MRKLDVYRAEGGTRTHTLLTAADFEYEYFAFFSLSYIVKSLKYRYYYFQNIVLGVLKKQ